MTAKHLNELAIRRVFPLHEAEKVLMGTLQIDDVLKHLLDREREHIMMDEEKEQLMRDKVWYKEMESTP